MAEFEPGSPDGEAGTEADSVDAGTPEVDTADDAGEYAAEPGDDEGEEGDGGAEDEEGDEEGEPEEIEFNFGGTKAKFRKDAPVSEVAEQVQAYAKSLEAGYTQKFQETAEIRKAAEAERAALDELSLLDTEALEAYAAAAQIRDQIGNLSKVDMQRLWQSNPDQARRVSDDLARLQQQQARATEYLDQVQDGLRAKHAESRAKAMEAGKAKVAKLDPEFESQAADVVAYVQEAYGMTKEQAEAWPASPEIAVMARKAMLWDQATEASVKQPKAGKQDVKPVRPIRGQGKPGSTVDPSRMSPAQMAKHLGLPG